MNNLGKRLKALRLSQGLAIKDIANAIGVAESTYRDWEYGRKIKGEPYEMLALTLNTSLTYLITGKSREIIEDLEKVELIVRNLKTKL